MRRLHSTDCISRSAAFEEHNLTSAVSGDCENYRGLAEGSALAVAIRVPQETTPRGAASPSDCKQMHCEPHLDVTSCGSRGAVQSRLYPGRRTEATKKAPGSRAGDLQDSDFARTTRLAASSSRMSSGALPLQLGSALCRYGRSFRRAAPETQTLLARPAAA